MHNNHPFRRVFDLDSAFNERASPRSKLMSDLYGMMDHGLFPQYHNRMHNFIMDPQTPTSPTGSSISSSTDSRPRSHMTTSIPVVHLPADSSLSSGMRRTNTQSSISSDSSSKSTRNKESEAEVDALTNFLIKSIGKNYKDSPSKDNANSNSTNGSKIHMTVIGGAPYSTKRHPTSSSTQSPCSTPGSLSRQSSISTSTISPGDCHRCRKPLELAHPNPHNPNPPPEPISGPLNTQFHMACFTCYRCNSTLSTDEFFYVQKRLLCPRCVNESLEKCAACDLVINDRIIRVLGRPYHPKCFTCVACNRCLDGLPFTVDIHDRTYCLDDFHRRYAPRCDACGQIIRPTGGGQENRRIVTGGKTYHLDCFGGTPTSSPVISEKTKK